MVECSARSKNLAEISLYAYRWQASTVTGALPTDKVMR